MTICIYGTQTEQREIAAAAQQLPVSAYRRIRCDGFADYDSFIAGMRCGAPDMVVVMADGAEGMEGVMAAKSLRPGVPVIWLSNDRGFGAQSYRLGCTFFHSKPVPPETLSLAMERCIDQMRAVSSEVSNKEN